MCNIGFTMCTQLLWEAHFTAADSRHFYYLHSRKQEWLRRGSCVRIGKYLLASRIVDQKCDVHNVAFIARMCGLLDCDAEFQNAAHTSWVSLVMHIAEYTFPTQSDSSKCYCVNLPRKQTFPSMLEVWPVCLVEHPSRNHQHQRTWHYFTWDLTEQFGTAKQSFLSGRCAVNVSSSTAGIRIKERH